MRYVVLLYGDETTASVPGTPEWDVDMAGYMAFGEIGGEAILGGEALHGTATCRTIRHDGGRVTVTDGPFAEAIEAMGGYYVLDTATLDEAIELTGHIPATHQGGAEVRAAVEWFDRGPELGPDAAGATRWLATIHGPEGEADAPGTPAWDEGAEQHGRFMAKAGDALVGGVALQPMATATSVRGRDGGLVVTDGPYAELIEVVGGFYVLRGTLDEVVELAGLVPVPDGGAVQLQQIMDLGG